MVSQSHEPPDDPSFYSEPNDLLTAHLVTLSRAAARLQNFSLHLNHPIS
jgi:hypothetical protein